MIVTVGILFALLTSLDDVRLKFHVFGEKANGKREVTVHIHIKAATEKLK